MKRIILAASVALSLVACQVNYEKTPHGTAYKIFAGSGGDTAKAGSIIKFNVEVSVTGRNGKSDSILQTTFGKMPSYSQVDTSERSRFSYMEIMTKLRTGDSAIVIVSVDTLKNNKIVDPNDSVLFVNGSSVQFKLKLIKVFKTQDEAMADVQKEMDVENAVQIKQVEDYMAKNGFKGIKTKSGAYVSIDNPGDKTVMADSGTIASMRYKGYLQSDGQVFDTNLDSSKGHTEPYDVSVGTQQGAPGSVITGLDEALRYFGKGGSGKVFIPAFLGYGPRGSGPSIPANANLVFDVQIGNVVPAPPMPANGGAQIMPQ